MIETNCYLPEELYHDYLLEQGFEYDVFDFMFGVTGNYASTKGDGSFIGGTPFGNSYYDRLGCCFYYEYPPEKTSGTPRND